MPRQRHAPQIDLHRSRAVRPCQNEDSDTRQYSSKAQRCIDRRDRKGNNPAHSKAEARNLLDAARDRSGFSPVTDWRTKARVIEKPGFETRRGSCEASRCHQEKHCSRKARQPYPDDADPNTDQTTNEEQAVTPSRSAGGERTCAISRSAQDVSTILQASGRFDGHDIFLQAGQRSKLFPSWRIEFLSPPASPRDTTRL